MTLEEAFERWFATAEASQVWSRMTVHRPFEVGYAAGRLAALRECRDVAAIHSGAPPIQRALEELVAAEEKTQ